MHALGIDIGGTGIKAAPVDVATGELLAERKKIATPRPATPAAVADVVRELAGEFGWTGITGATFPGVVTNGTVRTAANVDHAWIGTDAAALFGKALGTGVTVLNDADAAGIAELRFGVAAGRPGTVIFLTLGTGVGSGVFVDGKLVPNTEFGQMEIRGRAAERRSAAAARVRRGLSWKAWAADLDEHLDRIYQLTWPNLMILGGGVSKNADKYIPRLTVKCPVVPAQLKNDAGIIGAAIVAAEANPVAATVSGAIPGLGGVETGDTGNGTGPAPEVAEKA